MLLEELERLRRGTTPLDLCTESQQFNRRTAQQARSTARERRGENKNITTERTLEPQEQNSSAWSSWSTACPPVAGENPVQSLQSPSHLLTRHWPSMHLLRPGRWCETCFILPAHALCRHILVGPDPRKFKFTSHWRLAVDKVEGRRDLHENRKGKREKKEERKKREREKGARRGGRERERYKA